MKWPATAETKQNSNFQQTGSAHIYEAIECTCAPRKGAAAGNDWPRREKITTITLRWSALTLRVRLDTWSMLGGDGLRRLGDCIHTRTTRKRGDVDECSRTTNCKRHHERYGRSSQSEVLRERQVSPRPPEMG